MTSEKILHIDRLGNRGEGVARDGEARVFVPYALAGETVRAEVDGEQARLIDIVTPSPDRVAPICPHYTKCGGCAVQTLREPAYAQWKRGLVETALRNAGVEAEVGPLVDAHGEGRRRVTFHARYDNGKARVGFMAARSHEIVEIDACPLLAPSLGEALVASRELVRPLARRSKPLDISLVSTLDGVDVDIRGAGPLDPRESAELLEIAQTFDLARLTNHGRLVTLRRSPEIQIGAARITLNPGAFLQATEAGEEALATRVLAAAEGTKSVADLFCGLGAFALRLASRTRVSAYDSAAESIAALQTGARAAVGLGPVEAVARDLFARPLTASELKCYQVIVFDPPRAGALAQAKEIAKSEAQTVVAVSCSAQSFARDAAILIRGGYLAKSITPIDQFRYAPHTEIVAVFERPAAARKPKRRLLG